MLVCASVVLADNFREPFAEDSDHVFHWDDLTDPFQNAANWSRINNIGTTDLTTGVASHSNADVHVVDAFYDETWIAQYACLDRSTFHPSRCLHAHVRFDLSDSWGDGRRRAAACHEFGHSVGLGHRTQDCMKATIFSGDPTHYDSHSKAHINGRY